MLGCPMSWNIPEPTPQRSQEDYLTLVRNLNKEPLTDFIISLMTIFKARIEFVSQSIDEKNIVIEVGMLQQSIAYEKELFRKTVRWTEDRKTTNYQIETLRKTKYKH